MRLTCVLLFVKDLPRMAAFYSALLRAEPIAETRTEAWVEFEAGGCRVGLHAIPPEIAEGIDIHSPPLPREDVPVKLIFTVDDSISESERIRALGVEVVARPWGGFDAIDPEGNIFRFSG
jgi:extradiol dioxygenase family protein